MQKKYKIAKIINNNFISSHDANKEVIFMGKGIAFGHKVGDSIDVSKIEKVFILNDANQKQKFDHLARQIPDEVLNVCLNIVDMIEKNSSIHIDTSMYMALADHIAFAIERKKNGVELSNKMLNEVKRFYPKEINLGREAIAIIKKEIGIALNEDEAGFLAIHLINADNNENQIGLEQIKVVNDIVTIIQEYFEIVLDNDSFYYQRLITHLKFFVSRIFSVQEKEDNTLKDDFFYRVSKVQYPKIHKCVDLIAEYLDFNYSIRMKTEEKGYLVIHLSGLLKRKER